MKSLGFNESSVYIKKKSEKMPTSKERCELKPLKNLLQEGWESSQPLVSLATHSGEPALLQPPPPPPPPPSLLHHPPSGAPPRPAPPPLGVGGVLLRLQSCRRHTHHWRSCSYSGLSRTRTALATAQNEPPGLATSSLPPSRFHSSGPSFSWLPGQTM